MLTVDDFVLPPSTFIPPLQPSPTTPPHPVLVVLKHVLLLARPSAAARVEARINRLLAFAIAVAVARVDRVILLGLLASVRVVGRQRRVRLVLLLVGVVRVRVSVLVRPFTVGVRLGVFRLLLALFICSNDTPKQAKH